MQDILAKFLLIKCRVAFRIHFYGSGSSILGWPPIRIRIQSGSRAFMTKNWIKLQLKIFIIFFSKSKIAIYLSLGLQKVWPVIEEAFSSKRVHPTLQNMNFYKFFSTFVGHFCPPGSGSRFRIRIRINRPDWIRIQSGSGSETLIKWLYSIYN